MANSGEHISSGAGFRSYRDLQVWSIGIDVAVAAYAFGKQLPDTERYGLVSQIQRSATAVPANIAEGHGRESTQDFIRFLRIAQGSLKELETHLIVAQRVHTIDLQSHEALLALTDRLGRMLRSLIRSLQERRT